MGALPKTISVRNNEVDVTVTYRGETADLGVWDVWDGANVTADNTKHRRGGMGPQVAVGGPVTIEDLTVRRDYDLDRDHARRVGAGAIDLPHWLSTAVGRARITASKHYLDTDGIRFGDPIVITGILIGYNQPNGDSDSGDIAMVELVINPDGAVG